MNTEQNQLAVSKPQAAQLNPFSSGESFELAQRMAVCLASSSMVPAQYKGKENIGNAMIALNMSQRMGTDPLTVMQNLNIIQGKPSWSAEFVIAAINGCGRFSPLRYNMTGEGDNRKCTAWAYDLRDNEKLEGSEVSIALAKAEGWFQRKGSKWQTMPDQMLRYRAATFFGRIYAPDLLSGIRPADEVIDIESGATYRRNRDRGEPRNVTPEPEETVDEVPTEAPSEPSQLSQDCERVFRQLGYTAEQKTQVWGWLKEDCIAGEERFADLSEGKQQKAFEFLNKKLAEAMEAKGKPDEPKATETPEASETAQEAEQEAATEAPAEEDEVKNLFG